MVDPSEIKNLLFLSTNAIIILFGNPKSTIVLPIQWNPDSTKTTLYKDLVFQPSSRSRTDFFLRFTGTARFSHFATTGIVVPWIRIDVTEIKKTRLKIILAFPTPAVRGYIASTIGTAPLRPTHETNSFLRNSSLKNASEINTLKGLATNINNDETRIPIPR